MARSGSDAIASSTISNPLGEPQEHRADRLVSQTVRVRPEPRQYGRWLVVEASGDDAVEEAGAWGVRRSAMAPDDRASRRLQVELGDVGKMRRIPSPRLTLANVGRHVVADVKEAPIRLVWIGTLTALGALDKLQ